MRAWILGSVVVVATVIVGCSKPDTKATKSAPTASAAPSVRPGWTAEKIRAAQASAPPIEKLKADVRKLLPELRSQLAAGKVKGRNGPACTKDLLERQGRLRELRDSTLPATEMWMLWDSPHFDIAQKLDEEVIFDALLCVSCDERHGPMACTKSARSLGELEGLLAAK